MSDLALWYCQSCNEKYDSLMAQKLMFDEEEIVCGQLTDQDDHGYENRVDFTKNEVRRYLLKEKKFSRLKRRVTKRTVGSSPSCVLRALVPPWPSRTMKKLLFMPPYPSYKLTIIDPHIDNQDNTYSEPQSQTFGKCENRLETWEQMSKNKNRFTKHNDSKNYYLETGEPGSENFERCSEYETHVCSSEDHSTSHDQRSTTHNKTHISTFQNHAFSSVSNHDHKCKDDKCDQNLAFQNKEQSTTNIQDCTSKSQNSHEHQQCHQLENHSDLRIRFKTSVLTPYRKDKHGRYSFYESTYETIFGPNGGQGPRWATFLVRTERGNDIAATYLRCPKPPSKMTLLYSHGNATDLGHTAVMLAQWSRILKHFDICTYDYSGYGVSKTRPSEANVYADIRAVFQSLLSDFDLSPESIILTGFSLGTAASVDLASEISNIGGLILLSPFTSALRIVMPNISRSFNMDSFTSIDKIDKVKSLVLIIHGTSDKIVPWRHAKILLEKCPFHVDLELLPKEGHNTVEYSRHTITRIRSNNHQHPEPSGIIRYILQKLPEMMRSHYCIQSKVYNVRQFLNFDLLQSKPQINFKKPSVMDKSENTTACVANDCSELPQICVQKATQKGDVTVSRPASDKRFAQNHSHDVNLTQNVTIHFTNDNVTIISVD